MSESLADAAEIRRLQRMWAEACRDYGEARAEIERLTAYEADLRAQLERCGLQQVNLEKESDRLRAGEEELRAENERLRAALKPFADAADTLSCFPDDTRLDLAPITLGDLRRARRELEDR